MDSTKNVIVPINILECIRLHTRCTTIFSFCCRTSTSNKTYAWVQNTIHVALYMHYAWKIVNKCTKNCNWELKTPTGGGGLVNFWGVRDFSEKFRGQVRDFAQKF